MFFLIDSARGGGIWGIVIMGESKKVKRKNRGIRKPPRAEEFN